VVSLIEQVYGLYTHIQPSSSLEDSSLLHSSKTADWAGVIVAWPRPTLDIGGGAWLFTGKWFAGKEEESAEHY
jgi:hypothetical protein